MKVLFLVNVDWFFISHRLPIALAAIEAGYEVHLACSFTDKKESIKNLGIIVHDIPITRSSVGLYQECKTIKAIYDVFKKVKPHLVHAVTIKPVLYGGLILRFLGGSSFVAAVSGLGLVFVAEGVAAKIRKYLVKSLYKLALNWGRVKIIFQNTSDLKVLQEEIGLLTSQYEIINGSGVNLDEYCFAPEPTGEPVVVMAARLLIEKGVTEFVSAAKHLKKNGEKARFVLLGEPDFGNPNSVTLAQINTWHCENVVELLGHENNISKFFSNSHIVVHPSYYGEGLPKVLIEAAACGRAVVTTENPGCLAAVEPDKTALVVPARDVEHLSTAIKILLHNAKLRNEMGRQGRLLAERKFSIKMVIEQHLNIYKELLGEVQ